MKELPVQWLQLGWSSLIVLPQTHVYVGWFSSFNWCCLLVRSFVFVFLFCNCTTMQPTINVREAVPQLDIQIIFIVEVCFVLLFKAELFGIVSFIFANVYIAIILSFFASSIVLCIEEYNFLDMLLQFFSSHTFQLVWRQESALQIFALFSTQSHSLTRSMPLCSLLLFELPWFFSFLFTLYLQKHHLWIKCD